MDILLLCTKTFLEWEKIINSQYGSENYHKPSIKIIIIVKFKKKMSFSIYQKNVIDFFLANNHQVNIYVL